jgi:hypothetical protein
MSFWRALRSVLWPEKKWHFAFHLGVLLVSSTYWIGSLAMLPPHSMAEAIIYRPEGDDEHYPIITALSHFNFGDPTDARMCGQGICSFPVIGLLPHAIARALFGAAGFIIADALLSWLYFVGVTLFLRECRFGSLSSLVVAFSLATNGLQVLMSKLGDAFKDLAARRGVEIWDYGFPNLLELPIFWKRVPRPMVTEILAVFVLYFLFRLWREAQTPTLRRGLAIGSLMALMVQGDFYSVSALGLLLGGIAVWMMVGRHWRAPWRFATGVCVGAFLGGWFFLLQRILEHPDIPRRLGVAQYPRWPLLFLPGYAPLLRCAVICALAALLWVVSRRPANAERGRANERQPRGAVAQAERGPGSQLGSVPPRASAGIPERPIPERQLAVFVVGLMMAAWAAQPVQVFLVGKGTQIYHYIYVLATFYGYAALLLVLSLMSVTATPALEGVKKNRSRRWWLAALLVGALGIEVAAAVDSGLARVRYAGHPRNGDSFTEPWARFGESFRPNFRALDAEFRENPELRRARTISTFTFDVRVLLTAFYEKRAYNPDPFLSTLPDDEIEDRLCEFAKLVNFSPGDFEALIQLFYCSNNMLGHNKYRFASDHRFSSDDDYPLSVLAQLEGFPKQWGWNIMLPKSEVARLQRKYAAVLARDSQPAAYPDVIVLNLLETRYGLHPPPDQYRTCYTNEIFSVYAKRSLGEASNARP